MSESCGIHLEMERDRPGNLGISSFARAMLENLEPDKTQGNVAKCLDVESLGVRLEAELVAGGEAAFNILRDDIRAVAWQAGHKRECERFNDKDDVILRFSPSR